LVGTESKHGSAIKMWSREKLLHPATAIALVALFVSLGGVTYAAATIGTRQIENGAVTTAKLRNGAVSGAKLRKGAVTVTKIGRGAVRGDKIAREGVTARELQRGAVAGAALADAAVGASKLGLAAVTNAKLADGAVAGSKLADKGVAGSKLADGAVTAAKLAPGTAVGGSGQLLSTHVVLRNGDAGVALLALPGLGSLQASCTAGRATVMVSDVVPAMLDVQISRQDSAGASLQRATIAPPNGFVSLGNSGRDGVQSSTLQLSGGTHVATAWASVGADGSGGAGPAGNDCVVTVQALAS
jgi:hypothetical protein